MIRVRSSEQSHFAGPEIKPARSALAKRKHDQTPRWKMAFNIPTRLLRFGEARCQVLQSGVVTHYADISHLIVEFTNALDNLI